MSQQALNLRKTFDAQKNQSKVKSLNTQRHQGYLKEMLVQKFLQKYKIDQYPRDMLSTDQDARKLSDQITQVQVFVSQNFDEFIKSGSFTQKNLEGFEKNLLAQLQAFMKKEGMSMDVAPKIRGNAAGQPHARSQSSKFKGGLRTDEPIEDVDIGKGRFSLKNQERISQLALDLKGDQRSRRGNANLNDKQLVPNLSLPQIVSNRGGTISRTDQKMNVIQSGLASVKPPRKTMETMNDNKSSYDPYRLQNFRSSAQIQ